MANETNGELVEAVGKGALALWHDMIMRGTPIGGEFVAVRVEDSNALYRALSARAAIEAMPITAHILNDIAVMMSEFVDNWPQPKRLDTALALVAKTLRAAHVKGDGELVEALTLARNRLQMAAINASAAGLKEYWDYREWADEATAALAKQLANPSEEENNGR